MRYEKQQKLGNKIKITGKKKGFHKQAALAAALTVDSSTISRWYQGENITISKLTEVCQLLEVSADYLLFGQSHLKDNIHILDNIQLSMAHYPPEVLQLIYELFSSLKTK